MKKSKLKVGIGVSLSMLICSYLPVVAQTVQPGGSFSVNVSCGSIEGTVTVQGSNASISSAGDWCDRGSSVSVTATAGSAGTATVSVIGVDATSSDLQDYSGKVIGSASVSVVAPTPQPPANPGNSGGGTTQTPAPTNPTPTETTKKNTDSTLSSLSVSAGKLSPEFAAGTTAYKVELEESVTSLEVSATATDAKATVSGAGKIELSPGENSIKIDCKAEDGTITTYTIQAIVSEKPVTNVKFNDKELGVLQNVKDAPALTKDFSETKVKVDGVEVTAWKNESLNMTLVYLKDADGKNYYIYDEATQKVTSIYKPMALLGLNLIQIDIPSNLQTRKGMSFTTVEVDGQKLQGWTFDDKAFENYVLIYMMDEGGTPRYYQYEKTGNRLQLYSGAAAVTQSDYEALANKEQTLWYVIYGLGAGCVVSLGLAGYFFFRRKPNNKGPKRVDIEKENYEDRFHLEKEN